MRHKVCRRMIFKENRSKRESIAAFFLFAYLILKPFYLLDLPFQLSDLVLFLCFIYLACLKCGHYRISADSKTAYRYYFCFMAWTILINAAWYCWMRLNLLPLSNASFFKPCFYYIFNGIAITVVLWLYEILGDRLHRAFLYGCFASCMVTVFCSFLLWEKGRLRQTVAFENPNQLGYYAIILLTAAVLWGYLLSKAQLLFMIAGALYLNIISTSKASILAGLILTLLCIFYNRSRYGLFAPRMKITLILIGLLTIIGLMLSSMAGGGNSFLSRVLTRILDMASENDSNLGTGRGYNRIFEMNQHILWGTGEGAYDRFQSLHGSEIHSTIVSVYVCYGLIGFLLWLFTVIKLLFRRNNWLFMLVSFSGIFLYWITHNGIRNTMVWMVFMLVALAPSKVSGCVKIQKDEYLADAPDKLKEKSIIHII